MGTLYVVATPIGNLEDLSLRAERTLRTVGSIFCEDTRVTKKLLTAKGITTPCYTLHQHSSRAVFQRVLTALEGGSDVAYVSDAGTPGVSDPGGRLVEYIVAQAPHTSVVPIPGPSSVTTALQVAGLSADSFLFLGFVPTKHGRAAFFSTVSTAPYTTVFFESPHRIQKTLRELGGIDESSRRRMVIARELTKLHEEIRRGTVAELTTTVEATKEKGEFVVIVERHS